VLLWNQLPHLRAKRLIVASSLEHYDYTAKPPSILIEPWASRAMHQRFALARPAAAKGRRIYIDREQASLRKVINNAEVKAALIPYGFECVALETLSLAQKQELLASAEMVVGPAGAGFSNLVLCNPGCAVLIFYQQGFESDSFWSLCNNNQLTHYHLVCEPSQRFYPSESAGTINENFLVDIGKLVENLDFMTTLSAVVF
jgi:capsular polysaccharide biosynthesis protein